MVNFLNQPTHETQKEISESLKILAKGHIPSDYSGSPGNNFLVAGNRQNGFYGFVQPEDFGPISENPEASQDFNGVNLAVAIGLTAGTAINSNSPWMKFSRNGRVLFVPVKPLRHTVRWEDIYKAGAVYGDDTNGMLPPKGRMGVHLSVDAQTNSFVMDEAFAESDGFLRTSGVIGAVGDTIVASGWANEENNKEFTISTITNTSITVTGGSLVDEVGGSLSKVYNKTSIKKQDAKVTIDGRVYRVRLLKGASQDPLKSFNDADRDMVGPNSEWNSLILPLHEQAKLGNWAYKAYAGTVEDWGAGLTDKDLVTHHTFGAGNYTWCQETSDVISQARVLRGNYGASFGNHNTVWNTYSSSGWRPCLELL